MSLRSSLFSSKGRIARATFWGHIIGIQVLPLVAIIPLVVMSTMAENGKEIESTFQSILFIYILAVLPIVTILIFIAEINTGIKRSHDRNKSGLFILLGLIPIINLWALVELGFLRGTVGENEYGSDPIANVDIDQNT